MLVLSLLAFAGSAGAASIRPPHWRARAAVFGGKPAHAGSYPWVAHITYARPEGDRAASCTGTVIAPTLVLTAAHCAVDLRTHATLSASGYQVTTGILDLHDVGGQDSAVIHVIPCPCFDPMTLVGDAAILQLAEPVSAPPVALATEALEGQQEALVAGYGITTARSHQISEQLMYAVTTIRPAKFCARHAMPYNAYDELCTQSSSADASGTCKGDSGGPLLVEDVAGWPVEAGVTSYGDQRCNTTSPGFYTSVAALAGWLRGWIAAVGSPSSDVSIPTPRLPGLLTLASRHARLRGDQIVLALACTNPTGACNSAPRIALRYRTGTIITRDGHTHTITHNHSLVILSDPMNLPPQSHARVRIRLTAGQARLLRQISPSLQLLFHGRNVVPAVLTLAS